MQDYKLDLSAFVEWNWRLAWVPPQLLVIQVHFGVHQTTSLFGFNEVTASSVQQVVHFNDTASEKFASVPRDKTGEIVGNWKLEFNSIIRLKIEL